MTILLGTACPALQPATAASGRSAGRSIEMIAARLGLIYAWRHHRWPDFEHPRRFTEWVQWRKLNDRDPDLALLTDKSHAKLLAADALGKAMVVPTLWEGPKLPANPRWPMPFMVKANHSCGDYRVVRSLADYGRARRDSVAWMTRTYGGLLGEWHYRRARRGILVEPYIGAGEALPLDYKFYVFGGRAVMVQLHEARGAAHRWSQYDRHWRPVSTAISTQRAPVCLAEMIAAAERLGEGHDFLRVDFYEVGGQPLFGEYCLFPGSGLDPFDPVDLDDWLGALWSAERPEVAVDAGRRGNGTGALGLKPRTR